MARTKQGYFAPTSRLPLSVVGQLLVFGAQAPSLPLIHANVALQTTRTGQLLEGAFESLSHRGTPRSWEGMEVFLKQQVRQNEGSRQYQEEQREVAVRYGWRPDMVRMISRDLGLSGMRADRPGYVELLELIRTGQVGALFISDVSRAGREERTWFDLLELLIEHDVLLVKNGVITDPQDESQAFVTKIEAVIVRRENQMRLANMHRGRLAKARKGKAVSAPPIGYRPVSETQDGMPV